MSTARRATVQHVHTPQRVMQVGPALYLCRDCDATVEMSQQDWVEYLRKQLFDNA